MNISHQASEQQRTQKNEETGSMRSTQPFRRFALLWLPLLGLFYVLLFHSYRAYEIDNPWYLSFSHSDWVDHYRGDRFLNGVFPDGMGGTAVFGRLAAIIQGSVLNHFAWRPVPAMLLSTAIVLTGLVVWYLFLRRSSLSEQQSGAIIIALGLSEPFVGMAERFRYEPYSFLIMAGAFYLASRRLLIPALALALMALEIQPAAAIVFAALILYSWRMQFPRKILAGGVLSAGLIFTFAYALLHPHIAHTLHDADWSRGHGQKQFGGFLRAYFLDRRRHLPELILFSVTGLLFIRRYRELPLFLRSMGEITLLVCVFSFAMSWPTPAYMVFFFPFALVVVSWGLSLVSPGWMQSAWVLPVLMGLLMLPQYGALAWINRHEGFSRSDLDEVSIFIQENERRLGMKDATTEIMGDYTLWYAHPEHYRALARTTLPLLSREDMFLCFDSPLRPEAMVDPIVRYCKTVSENVAVHEEGRIVLRGHTLRLLVPNRSR